MHKIQVMISGKIRRRSSRLASSPYFIPISNQEQNHKSSHQQFEVSDDSCSLEVEPSRKKRRGASVVSTSSGCSSTFDEFSSSTNQRITPTTASDNDDNDLNEMAAITSSFSYTTTVLQKSSANYHHQPKTIGYTVNSNHRYGTKKGPQATRGLLDIAVRTIKLIRQNQELQQRLMELQQETETFIDSVMSNPENKSLRKPTE